MQPEEFSKSSHGNVRRHERGYWSFMPSPLPPRIEVNWELTRKISEADRAVAELAGIAHDLPNPHLLIGPFIRHEAVLSSRIEGTQASLSDLFFFEASDLGALGGEESRPPDTREVANYVKAMEFGLKRMNDLPLSLRLIREMHAILMEGVRGETMTPGEFRRTQNWIGPPGCTLMDAIYVPPPPEEMMEALGALEKFFHAESNFPPLVWLALVHYQFEAIHPFLDGNGRIGRLLISLLLIQKSLIGSPLLYLSPYFERHRKEYYDGLLAVSRDGAWIHWIEYFLRAVLAQARDARNRARKLLELRREYRQRFEGARVSALVPKLIDAIFEKPVLTIPIAATTLGVSYPAAANNIRKLVKAKILRETAEGEYRRAFVADEIIRLTEGELNANYS